MLSHRTLKSLPLKEIPSSALCKLSGADKSVSHLRLFLLPHFIFKIKARQGTTSVLCGHNYLHLRAQYNCFYRYIIFSEIFKKPALFDILPLQREDYFFRKEKESIRILHISDSLKINIYLALSSPVYLFLFIKER